MSNQSGNKDHSGHADSSAPAPVSCEIEARIRYCETDRMGYLHHSRHANLMEMGRTELLRRHGVPYGKLEDEGIFFAVREMNIRYVSPAYYDDVVTIRTTLAEFRRASLTYHYRLTGPDGRAIAEGRTVLACIDAAGKPRAIPAFIREAHGPAAK